MAESCGPRRLLADLAELTIWMTGSADFGPEGQAFVGWVKGKPALDRALAYLAEGTECFGDGVGVLASEADSPREDGDRGERAP